MARIMPDDRRPIANGAQTQAAAPTDTDLRRKLTTTMVLVLFALVAIAWQRSPGSPSPIVPRPACS